MSNWISERGIEIPVIVSIQGPEINKNAVVKEDSLIRIELIWEDYGSAAIGNKQAFMELLRRIGEVIGISGTYTYRDSNKGCLLDVVTYTYGDKFTCEREDEWDEKCGEIKESIEELGYSNVTVNYY